MSALMFVRDHAGRFNEVKSAVVAGSGYSAVVQTGFEERRATGKVSPGPGWRAHPTMKDKWVRRIPRLEEQWIPKQDLIQLDGWPTGFATYSVELALLDAAITKTVEQAIASMGPLGKRQRPKLVPSVLEGQLRSEGLPLPTQEELDESTERVWVTLVPARRRPKQVTVNGRVITPGAPDSTPPPIGDPDEPEENGQEASGGTDEPKGGTESEQPAPDEVAKQVVDVVLKLDTKKLDAAVATALDGLNRAVNETVDSAVKAISATTTEETPSADAAASGSPPADSAAPTDASGSEAAAAASGPPPAAAAESTPPLKQQQYHSAVFNDDRDDTEDNHLLDVAVGQFGWPADFAPGATKKSKGPAGYTASYMAKNVYDPKKHPRIGA